jgi:hypothetical protein
MPGGHQGHGPARGSKSLVFTRKLLEPLKRRLVRHWHGTSLSGRALRFLT